VAKGCNFSLYVLKFTEVGNRNKSSIQQKLISLDLTEEKCRINRSVVEKKKVIVGIDTSNFIACEKWKPT
jgi:hypothetical protein